MAMTPLESHPYALMLPALTVEEYDALKADIADHGILYPVIVDEDGLVLDGVHRSRIASELGIEPPVSVHAGLDDDRKLHLAVGLNMRRRHLDADRRRDLVRKLHRERGLSVRTIASVTGWSKSTVDRDLKPSPFEEAITRVDGMLAHLRARAAALSNEELREVVTLIADGAELFGELVHDADRRWKRGAWPPAPVEHLAWTFMMYTMSRQLAIVLATAQGSEIPPAPIDWRPKWDAATEATREKWADEARARGLLWEPSQMGQSVVSAS